MRINRLLLPALVLILSGVWAVPGNTQDLCEALVRRALDEASDNCDDFQTNSACYGFGGLVTQFFVEQIEGIFSDPGNQVELPLVRRVQTNALDIDEEDWGIAYFRVQMEGTTEEEPAVLIMMGDVTIENAVDPSQVEAGKAPLEDLFFSTGTESECALAPNRLIVQSPAGRTIQMSVNAVPVSISSTASFGFNEVEGNNVMYVHTVDGAVRLNPDSDAPRVIQAGTTSYAPLPEPADDGRYYIEDYEEFIEPVTLRDAEELGFFDDDYFATEEILPEELLNYSLEEEDLDALYEDLIEDGYCFGYSDYSGDCGDMVDYGEFDYDYDGYAFTEDDFGLYDYDGDGLDGMGNFYDGNPYYDALEEGIFENPYGDEDLLYPDGYEGTAYSNPYYMPPDNADDPYTYSYPAYEPNNGNGQPGSGYDGNAYSNPYYTSPDSTSDDTGYTYDGGGDYSGGGDDDGDDYSGGY